MVFLGVVVVLAGTVVGAAYVAGGHRRLAVVDLASGRPGTRTVTAPLGDRTSAGFELLPGASTVHLSIGDLGADLFRVSTASDAGIRPTPVVDKDDVRLQVTRDGVGPGGELQVVLAARVRWQLRFSGYADEQVLDLSGGRIAGVEMVAGTGRAEIDLPRASGTVPLRIAGEVNELTLRSPDGYPVRVTMGGGATSVAAGTRTLHDLPAGATLTPRNWKVPNRYDVTTASPVRSLRVQHLVE